MSAICEQSVQGNSKVIESRTEGHRRAVDVNCQQHICVKRNVQAFGFGCTGMGWSRNAQRSRIISAIIMMFKNDIFMRKVSNILVQMSFS